MTESEWLASEDPRAMLALFRRTDNYPVTPPFRVLSDRKLRLFAVACCRELPETVHNDRLQQSMRIAERHADGEPVDPQRVDLIRDNWPLDLEGLLCVNRMVEVIHPLLDGLADWGLSPAKQVSILREIAGNPFRPVHLPFTATGRGVSIPDAAKNKPSWRLALAGFEQHCPWLAPTVLSLADAAYEDRRDDGALCNDRLAILADALEEAGCQEESLLSHLRGVRRHWSEPPLAHVRGCWALDLILGKN